jgi:hypothetical protein
MIIDIYIIHAICTPYTHVHAGAGVGGTLGYYAWVLVLPALAQKSTHFQTNHNEW